MTGAAVRIRSMSGMGRLVLKQGARSRPRASGRRRIGGRLRKTGIVRQRRREDLRQSQRRRSTSPPQPDPRRAFRPAGRRSARPPAPGARRTASRPRSAPPAGRPAARRAGIGDRVEQPVGKLLRPVPGDLRQLVADRRVAEALEDFVGIGAKIERRRLQARRDVFADQPLDEARESGSPIASATDFVPDAAGRDRPGSSGRR